MPRMLCYDGTFFSPTDGVNQGCPLASVRFGAAVREALLLTYSKHPDAVYADDIFMRAPEGITARAATSTLISELHKFRL